MGLFSKGLIILVAIEFFYIFYLETLATTSQTTSRIFRLSKEAKCKIYCGRTRKKERRPLFLMLGLAANNKKRMVFMETIINDLVEILKSDTDNISKEKHLGTSI